MLPHILLLVTDQFRHDSFVPTLTPNLYELATANTATTTLFSNAYVSTPTCTPARAALLTGKSPWNHGMLGYAGAVDCEQYPTTLPAVLAEILGYETAIVGKNHFGTKPSCHHHNNKKNKIKNSRDGCDRNCGATTTNRRQRKSTTNSSSSSTGFLPSNNNNNTNTNHHQEQQQRQKRTFIDHGYHYMQLYDGLSYNASNIEDDYDEFFDNILPGVDPLSTCHLGWNDWRACPYRFEEYLHPTAWTTRRALQVIDDKLATTTNSTDHHTHHTPLFLKVSYHRPHSPYDPPQRLWDKHQARSRSHTTDDDPLYARNIGTDPSCWDREYYVDYSSSHSNNNNSIINNSTTMPPESWQGDPGKEAALQSRAAYLANVEFVDEGVGVILERWRNLQGGRVYEEDTLVIWTSDHGDMNGDHNLWRKGYPWEASSHVNMVMKLPASMTKRQDHDATTTTTTTTLESSRRSKRRSIESWEGEEEPPKLAQAQPVTTTTADTTTTATTIATTTARVSEALVELRDVAPTIYDLLGIQEVVTKVDPLVNGRSLLPILQQVRANANDAAEVDHSLLFRTHLDLEHSNLFGDDRIHWNAIVGWSRRGLPPSFGNSTDTTTAAATATTTKARVTEDSGSSSHYPNDHGTPLLYKYIFFAGTGKEQLFCLSKDPHELENLAEQEQQHEQEKQHNEDDPPSILSFWRTAMAKQFETEGRGNDWVTTSGNLVVRTKGTTFGPNYPCYAEGK